MLCDTSLRHNTGTFAGGDHSAALSDVHPANLTFWGQLFRPRLQVSTEDWGGHICLSEEVTSILSQPREERLANLERFTSSAQFGHTAKNRPTRVDMRSRDSRAPGEFG